MARLLMVQVDAATNSEIQSHLEGLAPIDLVNLPDTQALLANPTETLAAAEALIIGAKISEPVKLSQNISRLKKDLTLLIVCEPEAYPSLSKELQFAPYLSQGVRCCPRIPGSVGKALNALMLKARKKKRHRSMLSATRALSERAPALTGAPVLARLMEALPVGVVLLKDRRVIGYNGRVELWQPLEVGVSLPAVFSEGYESDRDQWTVELGSERPRTLDIERSRSHTGQGPDEILVVHDVTELLEAKEQVAEARARAATAEALARSAAQLKELNLELEEARRRAQDASRAKSAFLANMSHELRTPLNAIIGFGEILDDETFGGLNHKQNRYVGHILKSGRHLLRLINDILDLSKIEAGRVDLELENVDLASVIADVNRTLEPVAKSSSVELRMEPNEETWVQADRGRLNQILFNLLSNAVKFSQGGIVETTIILDGPATVRVCVSDTGRGLSSEDLHRIFGRFEQATPSQREGTGLGLAITRRLVELHGGTIWAESEGLKKGAQFYFTLRRPVPPDKTGR